MRRHTTASRAARSDVASVLPRRRSVRLLKGADKDSVAFGDDILDKCLCFQARDAGALPQQLQCARHLAALASTCPASALLHVCLESA